MNPVWNIENDFYSYLSGYANENIKLEERKGKKKRNARLVLVMRLGGQRGQNLIRRP